jgi:hypothetical protein
MTPALEGLKSGLDEIDHSLVGKKSGFPNRAD